MAIRFLIPVTLLSPLTPIKKGANALYIGVLSPLHPLTRKIPTVVERNTHRRLLKEISL